MPIKKSVLVCSLIAGWVVAGCTLPASADDAGTKPAADVVIERVAIRLKSPEAYRVPLALQPVQGVTVRAPLAGTVFSLGVKTGDKVQKQGELLRLDSADAQLRLQQAQAALQIATLEGQRAETPLQEIAALRVTMARHGVDLAQNEVNRAKILAALSGEVFRIYVSEGEFVMPGAALLDLADPGKLVVEVPIDRNTVKAGDEFPLTIDDRTVNGKVDTILPVSREFIPLQDILMSLGSARVVVDNADGKFAPGQPVRTGLIPIHPVAEVPNSSLVNTNDGTRRVQVIRDGFIRDIPVVLLGPVGETYSFVSGRLTDTDELIAKSSVPLVDGTWVRPKLQLLESQQAGTGTGNKSTPLAPPKGSTGF